MRHLRNSARHRPPVTFVSRRITWGRTLAAAFVMASLTSLSITATDTVARASERPTLERARTVPAVDATNGAYRLVPARRGVGGVEPAPPTAITTEAQLRAAWAKPRNRRIDLGADIYLRNCHLGDPIRESPYPMRIDGHGHEIRQTCFEKRLLRQDGTGYLRLENVGLSRGGSDGPGAAVTSRGEITMVHCDVHQNLAEEPGGAIFSMRRITVRNSVLTGNLANDDGGALYARRGGVQVYNSNVSNNLVDGSGGAIGSTGDILVVNSQVNGNTTDGDGGALYADEDGDVTVVSSSVNGNDADGPGGAIWGLDGDIAVFDSTLNGNRADDRGGAIGGESAVLVVNSTVARNLAVAHVGGGIWSRGDATLLNTTITNNYAEGQGGGVIAAGRVTLGSATILDNAASEAANLAAGNGVELISSVIGPARTQSTGHVQPTERNCQISGATMARHTWVTDRSCGLVAGTNMVALGDPQLAPLSLDADGRVRLPLAGSPVIDAVPVVDCTYPVEPPGATGFLLGQIVDWRDALTTDARGRPRPQGPACDVGAAEFERDE